MSLGKFDVARWSALLASVAMCGMTFAAEVVDYPKFLPDRAIDTSSLDSIVKAVVKPDMTQQDKFLALFNFYRRMIYHHRYMAGDRREIMSVINSYGCDLCGSQAGSFSMLMRHAGFNTRVAQVKAPKYGGHTAMEVEYDGQWHACDTMTAFYVLNRKGQIASYAEIKADPTLVTDAEKEGRAPKEYCLCSREIEEEQKGIEPYITADRPWSLLRWGEGTTVTGFWAKAAANAYTQDGTYGGYIQPGLMEIKLKPNEEYVRLWDNVGLWLKDPSFARFGPFHTCGHIDEQDAVNFKYFEPYKKTGMEFVKYCYRYYGNGWLEWKPDAKKGELKEFAQAMNGLEPEADSGMLKTAKADAPGNLTLRVKSPYAMVKVEMDLTLDQPDGATTTVYLGEVNKDKAAFSKIWEATGKTQGVQQVAYTNDKKPIYLYDVKVEAKGADVKFNVARLKTVFQLNWAALPSLYPGENTITVSARAGQKLQSSKLLVTCEWADGKEWKADHADTQTVTELPYTYKLTADVPADKMPKMKRLVMKLAPK
jgi:hypothetical protein